MSEQAKTSPWAWVIMIAVMFLAFRACDSCCNSEPKPKDLSTMTREEKIKEQFSAWDGSHIELEKYVKQSMNDPDSYEHIESAWIDNGSTITVTLKFRGANAFGGKVVNTVVCDFTESGVMLGEPKRLQ